VPPVAETVILPLGREQFPAVLVAVAVGPFALFTATIAVLVQLLASFTSLV